MKINNVNNVNFGSKVTLNAVAKVGDKRTCYWEEFMKEATKNSRFGEFEYAMKRFTNNKSDSFVAIDKYETKDAENYYIAAYRTLGDLEKDRKGIAPLYSINSTSIWLNKPKSGGEEIRQLADDATLVKTYPSKFDALITILKKLGMAGSDEYEQLITPKH